MITQMLKMIKTDISNYQHAKEHKEAQKIIHSLSTALWKQIIPRYFVRHNIFIVLYFGFQKDGENLHCSCQVPSGISCIKNVLYNPDAYLYYTYIYIYPSVSHVYMYISLW